MEGSSSQVMVFGGQSQSCMVKSYRPLPQCHPSLRKKIAGERVCFFKTKSRPSDSSPSITVCEQGVTVSAKYHTQNHNKPFQTTREWMPRSFTTLKFEVFYPWISNPEVFITIIYSLLLMACFSSTFNSSSFDQCCFSLHLCGPSLIYISSLACYISIVTQ